ncbi:MAG: peptide-methionine (S)-S-oxide reductase MsrA [Bacteroidota bacterium]
MNSSNLPIATIGGGCFWCVEAIFQNLRGVDKVVSGYSGGKVPNPTYKEVCSGLTGHAEVIQVHFDPVQLSYADLLKIFLTTHDPTTLNRQGADTGTQYRSVIFYHDAEQKEIAEKVLVEMAPHFDNPIVTELSEFSTFYDAEDYHQNYYNDNSGQGYCRVVISPKLQKFRQMYAEKLA